MSLVAIPRFTWIFLVFVFSTYSCSNSYVLPSTTRSSDRYCKQNNMDEKNASRAQIGGTFSQNLRFPENGPSSNNDPRWIGVSPDQDSGLWCISREKELSPKWTTGFTGVKSITQQKLAIPDACQNSSGNTWRRDFILITKPRRTMTDFETRFDIDSVRTVRFLMYYKYSAINNRFCVRFGIKTSFEPKKIII